MQHSGKLLIKVSAQPYNNLRLGEGVLNIPNYNLEPLFKGYQSTARFRADQRADNWFLGNPLSSSKATLGTSPIESQAVPNMLYMSSLIFFRIFVKKLYLRYRFSQPKD